MELSWPEQLICNQLVGGSNPSIGSEKPMRETGPRTRARRRDEGPEVSEFRFPARQNDGSLAEKISGSYQSGQMGQTVNLLAYAYGGSNPSLPTRENRLELQDLPKPSYRR